MIGQQHEKGLEILLQLSLRPRLVNAIILCVHHCAVYQSYIAVQYEFTGTFESMPFKFT